LGRSSLSEDAPRDSDHHDRADHEPLHSCLASMPLSAQGMTGAEALYRSVTPAILTASAQKAMSCGMNFANSSGVSPSGSTPYGQSVSINFRRFGGGRTLS